MCYGIFVSLSITLVSKQITWIELIFTTEAHRAWLFYVTLTHTLAFRLIAGVVNQVYPSKAVDDADCLTLQWLNVTLTDASWLLPGRRRER